MTWKDHSLNFLICSNGSTPLLTESNLHSPAFTTSIINGNNMGKKREYLPSTIRLFKFCVFLFTELPFSTSPKEEQSSTTADKKMFPSRVTVPEVYRPPAKNRSNKNLNGLAHVGEHLWLQIRTQCSLKWVKKCHWVHTWPCKEKKKSLRIALISIFSRNSRKIQYVVQAGQHFSLFSAL